MPSPNSSQSTFSLSAELKNRKELSKALNDAQKRAFDLRVPLTLIGRSMFRWSQIEIFNLSGPGKYQDLSTKPFLARWRVPKKPEMSWKYFDEGYKQYKQELYGFLYPILKATGRLQASLTEPGNAENYFNFPTRTSVEWGTTVPYAAYHQSEAPRRKIPRRPFLIVTDARLKSWKDILALHLHQAFAQPSDAFKIGGTD